MTSAWERTAQQPELRAPHGCRILRGRTCMRGPQCEGASGSVDGLQVRDLLLSLDQRNSNCSGAGIYPRRRAEAGDVRCSVLRQQAPESASNLNGGGRHLMELVRELVRCDG